MYVVLMHDIILFFYLFILLCCNLYLKMHVGLFFYYYCVVIYILKCMSVLKAYESLCLYCL